MSTTTISGFSRSIVFKVLIVLIFSMTLVVTGSIFIFTSKQTNLMLEWSFNNNESTLSQIGYMASSEMKQFGDRLTLLSKTSEIQSLDPNTAASYLKSYSISTLFISGETVTLYDRDYSFICDNSMVGIPTESPYPIDFSRITPHRPYLTPWFREAADAPPKRLFGISIMNRSNSSGYLIASFSLRILWTNFPNYKVGKNGFLVAINGQGEKAQVTVASINGKLLFRQSVIADGSTIEVPRMPRGLVIVNVRTANSEKSSESFSKEALISFFVTIENSNFVSLPRGFAASSSKISALINLLSTVIPITAASFSSQVLSNDLRTSPIVCSSSI